MKKLWAVILTVALLIVQMSVIGFASETLEIDSDGYYLINDAEDLYAFRDLVNGGEYDVNAKLTSDIVLNEGVLDENGDLNEGEFTQWYPIGDKNAFKPSNTNTFNGVFDGQNYTIYGLYYYATDGYEYDSGIGLFGTMNGGTVKNLTIRDSYFKTYYSSAFICGYSIDGTIENCDVYATIVGEYESAGICGIADKGYTNIVECNFYGIVNGTSRVGGICGSFDVGSIKYCNNYGAITGSSNVAGIAGGAGDYDVVSKIKCCINYAEINADSGSSYNYTGGISGFAKNICIEDCLNVGNIRSVSTDSFVKVGGIIGYGFGEIRNCLSYGNIECEFEDSSSVIGAISGYSLKNATYDTIILNNYYLAGVADVGVAQYGTSYTFEVIDSVVGVAEEITETQAKNGTVLELLNNEREGGPWEQNTRKDAYPYPIKRIEYIFPVDETTTIDHEYGIIYTYRQGLTDVLEVIGYNEDTNGAYVTVMSAPSFMNDQKLRLFGTGSYAYVYVNGPRTMGYRLVVYGDINDDSYVDVLDAFDVERTANGYRELIEYEFLAADIDKDGIITMEDYQSVVNIGLAS